MSKNDNSAYLLWNALSERYVDTLGNYLGLTATVSEAYKNIEGKINDAVSEMKTTIQKGVHKVILDYPKAALSWIGKNLAKIIGLKIGEKTSDEIVGKCRKVESQQECGENEVYKQESKECCSLGDALVCQPRCREVPNNINALDYCDIENGELPTMVGDMEKCCFPRGKICRKAKIIKKDGTIKCREGETLVTQRDPSNEEEELKLCCRDVISKQENGEDMLCVDVFQCVVDKFTSHLEILGDLLIEGPPLDDLGKTKDMLSPPQKISCPADISARKEYCPTPKKLSVCYDTHFPYQRAPELEDFLRCLGEKTGVEVPPEGNSTKNPGFEREYAFYGSVYTYENDNLICNYTRGEPVCSEKCAHSKNSCHYGGASGENGALAVDFGNEANYEKIKKAAEECGVPNTRILCEDNDNPGSDNEECKKQKVNTPNYHIHISMPSCDRI